MERLGRPLKDESDREESAYGPKENAHSEGGSVFCSSVAPPMSPAPSAGDSSAGDLLLPLRVPRRAHSEGGSAFCSSGVPPMVCPAGDLRLFVSLSASCFRQKIRRRS